MEFLARTFWFMIELAALFIGGFMVSSFGVLCCAFLNWCLSQLPFYDKIEKYIAFIAPTDPKDREHFMSGALDFGALLVFFVLVLERLGLVTILFNW